LHIPKRRKFGHVKVLFFPALGEKPLQYSPDLKSKEPSGFVHFGSPSTFPNQPHPLHSGKTLKYTLTLLIHLLPEYPLLNFQNLQNKMDSAS